MIMILVQFFLLLWRISMRTWYRLWWFLERQSHVKTTHKLHTSANNWEKNVWNDDDNDLSTVFLLIWVLVAMVQTQTGRYVPYTQRCESGRSIQVSFGIMLKFLYVDLRKFNKVSTVVGKINLFIHLYSFLCTCILWHVTTLFWAFADEPFLSCYIPVSFFSLSL